MLDCMQFLREQWDYLLLETIRPDGAAVEMAVEAVITVRHLARHLGVELQSEFGRGWALCSSADVADSLVCEIG